jgi:competence protein ComEC
MKFNRRIILILTALCLLSWSGAFALKAQRISHPPLKSDSNAFVVIQLYVGQGDCLLLISPDLKATLIDVGPSYYARAFNWDAALRVILPVLRGLGLKKLDQIILTHHDQDHLGGVLNVLEHFPVGRVFNNGRVERTVTYRYFRNVLKKRRIPLRSLREGDHVSLGRHVSAQVLSPQVNEGFDENDASLVMRVTYGKFEMLLTGDIESLAERALCMRYGKGLSCDYLKVPHHGSKTSSSFGFLKMTQPSVVGISVGKNNSYGHPSPVILKRYQELIKTKIFRTDHDGGFLFASNGTECFVATQKGKMEKVAI